MEQSTEINLSAELPAEYAGLRIDQALAKCFPDYSRARLTQWLKSGYVRVNGLPMAPKAKVLGSEMVEIQTQLSDPTLHQPEAIALDVVYEDDALLVINKPAGFVVHPGAGNQTGTLLNALLHHVPQLATIPRAGIIHRLDKDTTGLMVIAKTLPAHTKLVAALSDRDIKREYLALVAGEVLSGKTIKQPIGRHRSVRTKMAVTHNGGKPAVTHTRCQTRYKGYTLLRVQLETGRTHQIRVHLSFDGYPIVGDSLYGWRYQVPKGSSVELQEAIRSFKRQALHATRLAFNHPISNEPLAFEAPLPKDMQELCDTLGAQEYDQS